MSSFSTWWTGIAAGLRSVWTPAVRVAVPAPEASLPSVGTLARPPEIQGAADSGLAGSPGGGRLDVEREVRLILAGLAEFAAARRVRLEFAVQPDLSLRTDRAAFDQAVTGLVSHAAAQAPCGRVLVTGLRHGGRVQVAVLDDGIGADRTTQASALRDTERLVAMQGGTLDIIHQPGEGTTVQARWPDTGRDPEPRTEAAAQQVARTAPAPTRHSEFSN